MAPDGQSTIGGGTVGIGASAFAPAAGVVDPELAEPLLPQNSAGRHSQKRSSGSGSGRGRGPPPRPGGGGGDDGAADAASTQAGQASKVALNLINSGIGTSTVAMPLAVRTLGAGLAVGALLLQAALGIIANHIISRESARSDADSYADLMHARYGKWGGRAVALAQMVNSLGKSVVWLIILADLIVGSSGDGSGLLPELLRAAGHPAAASGDAWYLRRWPWILLLTALATPAVSVRSLDKLSGISLVGDVAVAVMTASGMALTVVAARQGKAHHIHWLPSKEEAGVESKGRLALEVASVFPVMMGAAFTQNNINSAMGQLRPYSQRVLDATQAIARMLTLAVFLSIGISNYAVFGSKIQPDVLLNYSGKSLEALLSGRAALALSATVKLSFLVNGLLSLPMYLFPYQRNLWSALPNQSANDRMSNKRSFALTNIVSLAGCAVVAMVVPSIWKPLKLLGGTAVSCMAFIFPGLVMLRAQRGASPAAAAERSAWDRALWPIACVLVAVGLLQATASIASQFI